MTTHAVVFYPDATIRVEAVGPFRSLKRAQAACDRLTAALDRPNDGDDYLYEQNTHRVAHVLTFITEAEAIHEYGHYWEPSDSGSLE